MESPPKILQFVAHMEKQKSASDIHTRYSDNVSLLGRETGLSHESQAVRIHGALVVGTMQ